MSVSGESSARTGADAHAEPEAQADAATDTAVTQTESERSGISPAEGGRREWADDEVAEGADGLDEAATSGPVGSDAGEAVGSRAGESDEAMGSELEPELEPEPEPSRSAPLADAGALVSAVEAILFVVEAPVTLASIAAAIVQPVAAVAEAVDTLRRSYDERRAGIELREVAGGVRIYTRPEFAPQVELFLQEGQRSRLTQAALETLAVIAYRQPVTRSRVSAIRGVNVDGVVRTLTSRGLVVEVGSDPETGGGLLRTTEVFLEKMGLESLEQLPSLAPLLPDLDGFESDEL